MSGELYMHVTYMMKAVSDSYSNIKKRATVLPIVDKSSNFNDFAESKHIYFKKKNTQHLVREVCVWFDKITTTLKAKCSWVSF